VYSFEVLSVAAWFFKVPTVFNYQTRMVMPTKMITAYLRKALGLKKNSYHFGS
jgi:hypothetical protein